MVSRRTGREEPSHPAAAGQNSRTGMVTTRPRRHHDDLERATRD
ncbi:hypothetical protein [Streptomyces kebangsaanensis]|nr:hypothetical protein [Streptomyces kebangsaanensis]